MTLKRHRAPGEVPITDTVSYVGGYLEEELTKRISYYADFADDPECVIKQQCYAECLELVQYAVSQRLAPPGPGPATTRPGRESEEVAVMQREPVIIYETDQDTVWYDTPDTVRWEWNTGDAKGEEAFPADTAADEFASRGREDIAALIRERKTYRFGRHGEF